jgi:hypothetical protein
MDQTKIQLSAFEMSLLNNSEWILTKNSVIKKAQQLLEQVQERIFIRAQGQSEILPKEILLISPKISKGENYRGLPWLMLDYPRYFTKDDVFAIRTMFWWGNYFSITLQLSGSYKQQYGQRIIGAYETLSKNDFSISIHEDEWRHELEKDNYEPLKELSPDEFAQVVGNKKFLKISRKISFADWDKLTDLLAENFGKIMDCLA